MFKGNPLGVNKSECEGQSYHGSSFQQESFDSLLDLHLDESSFMRATPMPILETIITVYDDEVDLFHQELDPQLVPDRNHFQSQSERLFKCTFCGKEFLKSTALGGHTSKMHPREKQEQRERLEEDKNLYLGKRKRISKFPKESLLLPQRRRKAPAEPNSSVSLSQPTTMLEM